MISIGCFHTLALVIAICCIFPIVSAAQDYSLTGEFPFDDVAAIYSGPFMGLDRSDLLVLHRNGSLQLENYNYEGGGLSMSTYQLALYSFDGVEFHRVWKGRDVILEYSLPRFYPVSRMAWCCGDFDNDGRYSIVTCNGDYMQEYVFTEKKQNQHEWPARRMIKAPEVWIDQLIACDIDGDSCDELVALEYLNLQDPCGKYHIGIYKIVDRTLVPVWRGLDGQVGGNGEIIPPTSFISKCRIDGIPGEIPVIMGSQSDMSPSSYSVIGKGQTGDYEKYRPFPIPQSSYLRKGERGAEEEHERLVSSRFGPVGGAIFNDSNRILHYGYFLDAKLGRESGSDPASFAILEDGQWRLLEKHDPSIGGNFCKFKLDSGKSGWLFIKDSQYFFYDELPLIY